MRPVAERRFRQLELAAALEASIDDEERLLTVWMSHCVPQAEIAAWLEESWKS